MLLYKKKNGGSGVNHAGLEESGPPLPTSETSPEPLNAKIQIHSGLDNPADYEPKDDGGYDIDEDYRGI
jgi:hypothetical protein